MGYYYILKCDSCGIQGSETGPGDSYLIPAGWYMLAVQRLGYTDVDAAFCQECWRGKTCQEAFLNVPWRRR